MPLSINSQDLSAATSGSGASHLTQGFTVLTGLFFVSGTVTAGAVALQVSPDGTNWVNAAAPTTLASNTNVQVTVTVSAKFARVAITTTVTGGASVTAWLDATGPLPNDSGWTT